MEAFLEEFQHLKIQLEEIKLATSNFDNSKIIGKGGFGVVHEGVLSHSKGQNKVAFKRLDRKYGQGDPEFWKEILMLSRSTHENLISLLGFCDQDGEKILVYEHASHGSLDRHLSSTTLTWRERLKICLGAARGLCYLHDPKETRERVLHRDIKSSNILLDQNWNAKISDMGLSKTGPANQQYTFLVSNVVGTFGYVDRTYAEKSILTKESDVYSFGVVLFEVLCGRLCVEKKNNHFESLVPMWRRSCKQKKLDEIIFQDLRQNMDLRSLEIFSDIAYRCLQKSRAERPKMSEVVEKLEIALRFQEDFEKVEPPIGSSSPNPDMGSSVHEGDVEKGLMTSSPTLSSSTSAPALVLANNSGKRLDLAVGRHNDTELYLAAQRGDLAAVKQILHDIINSHTVGTSTGADFDAVKQTLVASVNEMAETALYTASAKGHLEVVRELLKYSDKETISIKSRLSEFDALHVAASHGHLAVVQLLLDHDPSLCCTFTQTNQTPLVTAAAKGHTDVVRELLLKNPSLLDISRSDGKNALHLAARLGDVETLKTLLENGPEVVRRTDKKGQTALHMAVKGVSSEVVKLLLEADASLAMLQDNSGNTALHVATRKRRPKIVNELLSVPDANVNALTRDHKTAFDIAEGLPLSEESAYIRDCLLRYIYIRKQTEPATRRL